MKRQKTYRSEKAILADIDANQVKAIALLKESEELETEGHKLVRTGNDDDVANGSYKLSMAVKKRESANRVQTRLNRLKEALAAFKTELLPMVTTDRKVVL